MCERGHAGFQRQHSLSWIFQTLAVVRSAIVPAVLFLVFSQGLALGWLAGVLALPAVAVGVARHLALSYRLGREALVVRDGILRRTERRIRFSRIQNLDEVQGLLHRFLGVVAVKVETASGGKPEAVLQLSPSAAARLRERIFADRTGDATDLEPGPATAPLVRVPLGDLVRLGLIQNRGLVVVAAAAGVLFQSWSDFMPWERVGSWIPDVVERGLGVPDLEVWAWALGALALTTGAYLALSLLSIALAVGRFFGFTLWQTGDDLAARFGLLVRVQMTVPRRRIQRLLVDESLLHRIYRRISVRLDTAGGQGDLEGSPWQWEKSDGAAKGRQWLSPVSDPSRLPILVAASLPDASGEPLRRRPGEDDPTDEHESSGWRPIARRAVHRLFRKSSLGVLIVTFALVWLTRWSLLLPLTLPAVWWLCQRTIASRFYWATEDALWWRSGWLGRQLVVVPYDKIQSVMLRQTPFDRHHEMARVTVDTAGSGMWPAAHVAYLDHAAAQRLAVRLAREAARREFVWS